MKLKKEELMEIIDSNGELIGGDNIPKNGSDLESQANNTTDYNQKIGTQPYRYDLLAMMGFGGLMFYEGKEDDQSKNELLNNLTEIIHKNYVENLKYFYKNPNKIKSEYRQLSGKDFADQTKEQKEKCFNFVQEIIKIFQDFLEKNLKQPENIDEAKVVEDKMINKKSEDEISKKSEGNEIKNKKLQKIAGLINKLDKKDVDEIINLLEINK